MSLFRRESSGRTAPFTGGALPEGTELVPTATAADRYCFVGWEGDVRSGNTPEDWQLSLPVTFDVNVTAVFRAVAGRGYVAAGGATGRAARVPGKPCDNRPEVAFSAWSAHVGTQARDV